MDRLSQVNQHGVTVRGLIEDDVLTLFDWRNDLQALPTWSALRRPATILQFGEELRSMSRTSVTLVCANTATGRLLGWAQLAELDEASGTASVLYIVAPEKRTELSRLKIWAFVLVLRYAFDSLGLRRIYADTVGFNHKSYRALEDLQFDYIGSIPAYRIHRGVAYELRHYSLDEFRFRSLESRWELRLGGFRRSL
jgi:RimJ/RimL family protein N-acetyltransferase